MEVKYKRDANKNYMILNTAETLDYQLKMLCENNIKGLLRAHTSVFDGKEEIYYEISSKQPLSRIYAKKEMCYEDLKRIIYGMENLFLEIKKYLLDSKNILLGPDFCYCSPDNKKTEWIFYPGERKENDFMELAEFFLEHVDHKDEKGVDLAYKFFKSARSENFVLQEIMLYVEEQERSREVKTEEPILLTEEKEVILPISEVMIKESFWDKAKKIISEKMSGIKEKTLPTKPKRDIPMMSVSDWEGLTEENNYYTGETTVIGISRDRQERRMRSLNAGECGNISLAGLPCILGKMPEQADVILSGDGISRMHAKIYEESGNVFLQDLNSTNGTFKNGIRLEANETVQLRAGDEIGFAKLRYIYE